MTLEELATKILENAETLAARVNARMEEEQDDIREAIVDWIKEELSSNPVHYEIDYSNCTFDHSGELRESGHIELDQTIKKFLEYEYTGSWEPSFCSGYGKRWRTYGDSLSEDTVNWAEKILLEVVKDYAEEQMERPLSDEEFFDLRDVFHDEIYDQCVVSDFFFSVGAVNFVGIGEMPLTALFNEDDYNSTLKKVLKAEDERLEREKAEREREALFAAERKRRKQERKKNQALAVESIKKIIPQSIPDLFPEARLLNRKFILHVGPCNSGKTYEAIQDMIRHDNGIYLAPLRLLALEKYEELNAMGIPCSMITGEEELSVEGSKFESATIEMLQVPKHYDCAVIDEAQMIEDQSRGGAWSRAILGLNADVIHICLAPYALDIVQNLITQCGDSYEIQNHTRNTPLEVQKFEFKFPEHIERGDAVVVFSKMAVHYVASDLQVSGYKCSVLYGAMPHDVRRSEAEKFRKGETDVVVCTDCIGMGVNMPIRRVVFMETTKYDGVSRRPLLNEEIQQIAGRAGRYGIYDIGYVTSIYDRKKIRKGLTAEVKDIIIARLAFPERLLNIDGKLSDILVAWNSVPLQVPFVKNSLADQIEMTRYIEDKDFIQDKKVIYELITINVNRNLKEGMDYWKQLVFFVSINDPSRAHSLTSNYPRDISKIEDIHTLEEYFSLCDMIYSFFRKFGTKKDRDIISSLKDEISNRLIKILSNHRFASRKCKNCGCRLEWNYPYGYCEDCYDELFRSRYSYYDDDDYW